MSRTVKPVPLAGLFAAFADRTRLRLLNLMNGREVCVCYLVEILNQSQPKVSRHLAYLRNAGVVSARRDGKWMHYSIQQLSDPGAAAVLEVTLATLADDREMQSDLARLAKACCEPLRIVTLQSAPVPARLDQELAEGLSAVTPAERTACSAAKRHPVHRRSGQPAPR